MSLKTKAGRELARHVRVKALVRLGDENCGCGQGKPKQKQWFYKGCRGAGGRLEDRRPTTTRAPGKIARKAEIQKFLRGQEYELEKSMGANSKRFRATR